MKKIGLIFPGQGSQAVGMGKDLYDNSKIIKELFEKASDALGFDMSDLCFAENENLNKTAFTQPAILLVSLCAYELVKPKIKEQVAFGLGHSLGEFSALCASGVLSIESALKLVKKRGELMEAVCAKIEAAMMVVLGLDDSILEDLCEKSQKRGLKVWCANYNGDGQIVLAGSRGDLAGLESVLKGMGAKRAMMLPMSVASHCPLLEPMCAEFSSILGEFLVNGFDFPIISNATAKPYNTREAALDLLSKQLVSPVLYKQSIRAVDTEVSAFVECGGSVLKGLNKRLCQNPTISLTNYAEVQDFLNAE